jgi:hypothetical protein
LYQLKSLKLSGGWPRPDQETGQPGVGHPQGLQHGGPGGDLNNYLFIVRLIVEFTFNSPNLNSSAIFGQKIVKIYFALKTMKISIKSIKHNNCKVR